MSGFMAGIDGIFLLSLEGWKSTNHLSLEALLGVLTSSSQTSREIQNCMCVSLLKSCIQLLSFSLLLAVASRTAQNPGKIPPKEDFYLIVLICWQPKRKAAAMVLLSSPLLLHAPFLREVCSLPFKKMFHDFRVLNFRHHC